MFVYRFYYKLCYVRCNKNLTENKPVSHGGAYKSEKI